jgi:hypothetical protein
MAPGLQMSYRRIDGSLDFESGRQSGIFRQAKLEAFDLSIEMRVMGRRMGIALVESTIHTADFKEGRSIANVFGE